MLRVITKVMTALMIFLLTACSPNTTVFTGESGSWEAELKIN
ncbi:hypothetical protein [Metabacillus indicus]|nr:hypothetical protein [Metabacillus indicus]